MALKPGCLEICVPLWRCLSIPVHKGCVHDWLVRAASPPGVCSAPHMSFSDCSQASVFYLHRSLWLHGILPKSSKIIPLIYEKLLAWVVAQSQIQGIRKWISLAINLPVPWHVFYLACAFHLSHGLSHVPYHSSFFLQHKARSCF